MPSQDGYDIESFIDAFSEEEGPELKIAPLAFLAN